MRLNLLLVAVGLVSLGSCSTAYKSGQTPDDLYYSPGRSQDEYVRVDKNDDRSYSGDDYYEDRYLRMRVQNRNQWSVLDDYYFNNPYAYNYYGGAFIGGGWNNPWNSYHTWNNFYNPYARGFYGNGFYGGGYYGGGFYGGGYGNHVIIVNQGNYRRPNRPIVFNPSSYGNGNNSRSNNARNSSRSYINNNNNGSRYNNSNGPRTYNFGNNNNNSNSGRRIGGNDTYRPNNNNNNTPSRSYNPSSSNNNSSPSGRSSGSSSGSGSGGSSRPPR